jgi:hypothetical protein
MGRTRRRQMVVWVGCAARDGGGQGFGGIFSAALGRDGPAHLLPCGVPGAEPLQAEVFVTEARPLGLWVGSQCLPRVVAPGKAMRPLPWDLVQQVRLEIAPRESKEEQPRESLQEG